MMKNGLLEMFNIPITDHAEMRNVMECRKTMKEILGGINNQPANKNFSKPIVKWKIPKVERPHNKTMYDKLRRAIRKLNTTEIEMQNKPISVRRAMMEVRVTSLSNNQNAEVIEVEIDNREHMVLEEGLYQMEETYITRTETIMHTRAVRTTAGIHVIMDHG